MSLLLRVTPSTVDTATVSLALTPSAVEEYGHSDAATETFALTPSSTDIAADVESNIENFKLTPTGSDSAAYVEAPPDIYFLDWESSASSQSLANPLTWVATSFVAPTGLIRSVELVLKKAGSPVDNIIVELRADSGFGEPGSTVLGSTTIPAASIQTSNTLFEIPFSTAIQISSPATIWIVARRSGVTDSLNRINAQYAASTSVSYVTEVSSDGGSSWGVSSLQLAFGVRYILEPTDIIFSLTPSASDIAQFVDAATELFALTPSATEEYGHSDADTELFKLTPSGTDDYTAGAAEYTDADTEVLALVPSATEIGQSVDTAIESFSLVPSGSDIFAGVDTTTENFAFTPSGTDIAEYVDSGREDFSLTPSADESLSGQTFDSATTYLYLDPIGTTYEDWFDDGVPTRDFQYFGTYVESDGKLHLGNGITNGIAYYNASAEFEQITITLNNLDILLAPFSLDLFTDTLSSGGCGILIAYDGANPYFQAEIFGDNGSADASSGLIYGLDVSSRFYLRVNRDHPGLSLQFSTNGVSWTTLISSSVDWYWMRRTVDTSINVQSGAEVDIEHFLYEIQTVDIAQFSDTNTGLLSLVPSSDDFKVIFDSGTERLSLIPSSTDIAQFIDVLTTVLALVPSGVDLKLGAQDDADTLYLHLIPGGVEVKILVQLVARLYSRYTIKLISRYTVSMGYRRWLAREGRV